MSEEELNQELSTDELKDVAGGLTEAAAQSKTRFRNKYEQKTSRSLRMIAREQV